MSVYLILTSSYHYSDSLLHLPCLETRLSCFLGFQEFTSTFAWPSSLISHSISESRVFNPHNITGYISKFTRGQIVGVHLTDTSVTRRASLYGVLRATVSKVMSARHHKRQATFNCKHKRKLSEKDVQVLTHTISKKHKSTSAQFTSELNAHRNFLVSTKTVHQEQGQYSRSGLLSLMTMPNICFNGPAVEILGYVKHVLFSDESIFTVIFKSGRGMVWRNTKKLLNAQSEAQRRIGDGLDHNTNFQVGHVSTRAQNPSGHCAGLVSVIPKPN